MKVTKMTAFRSVRLYVLGVALAGAVGVAYAHGGGYGAGPGYGQSGAGYHHGPHMPGPGYGPGMMGPGYGRGYGPGMMGPGYERGYGRGMMGPGYGQGYGPGMMGPGMMGPRYGQGMMGPGYGRGMMGPYGQGPSGREPYGSGAVPAPDRQLSTDEVRSFLDHWVQRHGLTGLTVGDVLEVDEDTIVAELADRDGKVVQRYEFDRHTGAMRPAG